MRNPNRRTEKVLSRQIEALRTAIYDNAIEFNLLDWYLETEPDLEDNPDRPSDEEIQRDIAVVLEEAETLESKLVTAMKAWSTIAWRELGQ